MFRFVQGFIIALSGDVNIIEACSGKVPGWLDAGEREKKDNASKKEMGGETSSTFMKILGYLGKAVDFICIVKYKIMSFLTISFRRRLRLFIQGKSRVKRMKWFGADLWKGISNVTVKIGHGIADVSVIVGKSVAKAAVVSAEAVADASVISAKAVAKAAVVSAEAVADASVIAAKGVAKAAVVSAEAVADVSVITAKAVATAAIATAEGVVEATLFITNKVEKIARATANLSLREIAQNLITGVYDIGSLVIDGANLLKKTVEQCLNYLKEKIQELFKPFWDLLDRIKTKIMNYLLKSELFRTLFPFAECFVGLHQVKESIKMFSTITTLIVKIPQLAVGFGWIELCVNLFCGWRQVKQAIEWLLKANDEPDPLEAYSSHGKFAGYLMGAVAGN